MQSRKTLYKFSALILFLATLSQCGGDSKATKVEISVLPKSPIVITAPKKTIDGEEVQAPWFEFRVNMRNNSTETVTIIALEASISIFDETGNLNTATANWTPSDFDYTRDAPEVPCNYFVFAEIGPDSSAELGAYKAFSSDTATCADRIALFVASALPKTKSNYRYRVTVKPIGWFGTYAEPTDRFERTFSFSTQ